MFKSLGILAWAACLLTLAYQGTTWVFTKTWPALSLLDILQSLLGFDILTILRNLPMDVGAKVLYICFTTELSLFLWWMGVTMFVLFFIACILRKRR